MDVPDKLILDCSRCDASVISEVLAHHVVSSPEGAPWDDAYYFVRCPQCSEPAVIGQAVWFGESPDDPVRLYPPLDQSLSTAVPEEIRTAFDEAVLCHRSGAHTAAAVMCRRAVEGLCADRKAKGRTLAAKLKDLKDTNVIENRLFEWADQLRISGNEAAHDVHLTVPRDDAKDIMEFTRALMEYVYTFGRRFERFTKRRAERKS